MLNKALYTNMLAIIIAFSEIDKFNGTNWFSWQRLIHTVAISKGVFKYLDKSIKCPSTLPVLTTVPTETVMNIEWDYNYYQPWSDNEWLVNEMIALVDEDIIM